jgi:hypothetical protein
MIAMMLSCVKSNITYGVKRTLSPESDEINSVTDACIYVFRLPKLPKAKSLFGAFTQEACAYYISC